MQINNSTRVRSLAILVCALLISSSSARAFAQAEQQLKFPFQAFVLHDKTTIHSGPGQVHYATEELEQGAVVEVYREDPGGWCAIRPVDGSFSLVPEPTLEIVENGVGRIREDGTQAWVGTKLGPVDQPLWQVKLKKGELVEVLGQVSWPSPEGHSTIWYQISPPAGEFRWVRMSDIQLPANVSPTSPVLRQENPTVSPSSPQRKVRSLNEIVPGSPTIDFNTKFIQEYAPRTEQQNLVQLAALESEPLPLQQPNAGDTVNMNRGWRQATRSIGAEDGGTFSRGFGSGMASDGSLNHGSTEVFHNRPEGAGESNPGTSGSNDIIRIASADVLAPDLARNLDLARSQSGLINRGDSLVPFQTAGQSAGMLTRNLSGLELQLTRELVKQDPSDWRLEDLEIAANGIYRNSQNPNERSLAERYLTKLANCKAIRSGYRENLAADSTTFTRQSTQPIGSGVNAEVELGTTYDAHGWLTELVRDGGSSQTEYALQDDNGKITHHIAPAPGMNLRRYLKSRVGVIGQRGYHSQLKLDHVTAHRIVELEKPKSTFQRQ